MQASPSNSSAPLPETLPRSAGGKASGERLGNTAEAIAPGITYSLMDYLRSLVEITGWQLLSTVVLMTLASLSEGLGIAMLFPVLDAAGLNMTNEGHVGHYTAEVRHLLAHIGLPSYLWLPVLLMVFLILMALRSLFVRAQSVRTLATVLKFEMALSRRLYQAIVNAEWLFLARNRTSNFTHALTAEVSRISAATYLFVGALSSTILAIVYLALALKLSAGTTFVVLASGALLLLASRRWMRAVHESGRSLSDRMSDVYSAATEHMQNLKAVKTYGAQGAQLGIFSTLEAAVLRQSLHNTRNQAAATFWFDTGSLLVLGVVIFVSLLALHVGAASLLLLLAIFTRLMPRLATGNSQIQAFLADLPAFENIEQIRRECLRHAEPLQQETNLEPTAPARARMLRLDEVSFAYGPDLPLVLNRISLTLAAGEITAILGPSGAGKSTIADLLNGLLNPTSGRVLVDGTEIDRQGARLWRRQVGYVGPDTLLFHDSVRNNLLWAQPAATGEDLKQALALADAEFAYSLPRGLDTPIGDRGILLSNGQRQRIALARALLRKPSLLVLDEATNSLDAESEGRILDSIERLKGPTTIVILGHRGAVARRAETIYVIERGSVVEVGDWAAISHRFSAEPIPLEESSRR